MPQLEASLPLLETGDSVRVDLSHHATAADGGVVAHCRVIHTAAARSTLAAFSIWPRGVGTAESDDEVYYGIRRIFCMWRPRHVSNRGSKHRPIQGLSPINSSASALPRNRARSEIKAPQSPHTKDTPDTIVRDAADAPGAGPCALEYGNLRRAALSSAASSPFFTTFDVQRRVGEVEAEVEAEDGGRFAGLRTGDTVQPPHQYNLTAVPYRVRNWGGLRVPSAEPLLRAAWRACGGHLTGAALRELRSRSQPPHWLTAQNIQDGTQPLAMQTFRDACNHLLCITNAADLPLERHRMKPGPMRKGACS
ncbi:hypothetical protein BU16DRAFT_598978 [Lophium mytilinum]|uniref:Uncharacterized protein n=1 Tax=Lophium mytilinum TaxID=390894 RepID=A0A6A6R9Q9_9PEZI|nr:hypothetical protein BU16DRAFT_598978 [Lophium mytilinum]